MSAHSFPSIVALAAILLCTSPALGDTFRDGAGNVVGKSRTDGNGVTTFYGPSGFVAGKARSDRNGVTRFYDRAGRVVGTAR